MGLPHSVSVRRCATITRPGVLTRLSRRMGRMFTMKVAVPVPFVLWGGHITLQYYFGNQDDFFKGSFITEKDLDALAEFYQAEDLLKIIAIHPILFNFFMDKVDPDAAEPHEDTALLSLEETHFRVKSLGMDVSFEIIQQ